MSHSKAGTWAGKGCQPLMMPTAASTARRGHLELGPGRVQELLVNPVGEQRDSPRLPGHLRQQLVSGHDALAVIHRHVAPGHDPVQCLLRQAPGDQNGRPRPAHR